jgi:hypothetical protein
MSAANVNLNIFRKKSGWKSIVILCIILTVIRLISVGTMGLMPQDAYYDFYAQHLDLSYFDHPPMIAYMLRLFTTVFGKKDFVIKIADTTVTLLTLLAFFQLAKRFLSPRLAANALVLLISTLMISILSLVSTPDIPLMLCWTLTLICLHSAIWEKKNVYWIWSGIFTGLSFDSKYTAVFLIFGLIGFLMICKPYRKLIFSRWTFLYFLFFAITISPVVIWNIRNGFASFKFQSEGRANEGLSIDPTNVLGVIGHQSAVLLPILLFSFIYFIYRYYRKYGFRFVRIPADQLFLLCFFIPLFAGFFVLSFVYWIKINWMFPAYISGIIWICRYWNKKWLNYQLYFSLLVHLCLLAEIIFYPVPIQSDDTWFGWKDFSTKVEKIKSDYPGTFIFSMDDYKTSAMLNFYLTEPVYASNVVGRRALQFDFIGTDLSMLYGKDAIYIDSNPHFSNLQNENYIPDFFYNYFDEVLAMKPILIDNNGQTERKFSVFLCKNYHAKKIPVIH